MDVRCPTMAAPREGPAHIGFFLCFPFLTASEVQGTYPTWGVGGVKEAHPPGSWVSSPGPG